MADAAPAPILGLIPYINPSDAAAASEFYQAAFGAEVTNKVLAEDGRRLMHCAMTVNGSPLYMSDSFPDHGHPFVTPQGFNLHLQVEDARFWYDRAVAAGCTVTMPLKQEFWGDFYAQLKDPYGIAWAIGSTPKKP